MKGIKLNKLMASIDANTRIEVREPDGTMVNDIEANAERIAVEFTYDDEFDVFKIWIAS